MAPTPCPSIALGNGAKCIFLSPSPNLLRRHSLGWGLEMDTSPQHRGCDIHWLWEALGVEGLGVGQTDLGLNPIPAAP